MKAISLSISYVLVYIKHISYKPYNNKYYVNSLPGLADFKNEKIAGEIAKQLNKFHQVNVRGPKEPQLWNDIFKFYEKGYFC